MPKPPPSRCPAAWNDRRCRTRVELPGDFYLAQVPVTNALYRRFVAETGHRTPGGELFDIDRVKTGKGFSGVIPVSEGVEAWERDGFTADGQPVAGINYMDAAAFCAWLSAAGAPHLPPAGGLRVGVRLPRRHRDAVLVGRPARSALHELRGVAHRPSNAGRLLPAEPVGVPRPARQRRRVLRTDRPARRRAEGRCLELPGHAHRSGHLRGRARHLRPPYADHPPHPGDRLSHLLRRRSGAGRGQCGGAADRAGRRHRARSARAGDHARREARLRHHRRQPDPLVPGDRIGPVADERPALGRPGGHLGAVHDAGVQRPAAPRRHDHSVHGTRRPLLGLGFRRHVGRLRGR